MHRRHHERLMAHVVIDGAEQARCRCKFTALAPAGHQICKQSVDTPYRSPTHELYVSLAFPIIDDLCEPWRWPLPPFSWRHVPPNDFDEEQPCRIESSRGVTVEGHVLSFEPKSNSLIFRSPTTGPAGRLSFKRIRRLTLTSPLEPAARVAHAPVEAVPSAAQERDYRLESPTGEAPLSGRTAGYVQADEGLYLFTPVEDSNSLMRVFVPRSAYSHSEFGRSAQEIAAERWITAPNDLLTAIEHQQRMPVKRMGQSLVDLGLITSGQLERALANGAADMPLGERLVASGVITRADLQTALAFKMGYPLVDLSRFPIDPDASRLMSPPLALRYRALPLMKADQRLIVAVDQPQRVAKIQGLCALSGLKLVPVLARKSEIILALMRLTHRDQWVDNVGFSPAFFATTS